MSLTEELLSELKKLNASQATLAMVALVNARYTPDERQELLQRFHGLVAAHDAAVYAGDLPAEKDDTPATPESQAEAKQFVDRVMAAAADLKSFTAEHPMINRLYYATVKRSGSSTRRSKSR
jgi:hypothetical protein